MYINYSSVFEPNPRTEQQTLWIDSISQDSLESVALEVTWLRVKWESNQETPGSLQFSWWTLFESVTNCDEDQQEHRQEITELAQ